METELIRRRIRDDVPRLTDELARLVAIPSVGYAGYDPAPVRASAQLTRDILADAGLPRSELIELPGGHPAVFGQIDGPAGAPTVLLYAHHDVQPAADPAAWSSPPFEPQVRDGRLFGRGSADDKSGVAIHGAALRALLADGQPPCTVKVIVEGEEECSVEHLPDLVVGHAEQLRADVAVIADGGNYRTGEPTIGTSVRGMTSVLVTVDVLPIAQHSGTFGGPLPDAVMSLARIIASLHDEDGAVAVEGLHAFAWQGTQISEEEFREEARVFPEVRLLGSGAIADRTLSQPSINVLAFEAPRVAEVANQIVPTARAVVGLRLAPGEDIEAATDALAAHLRTAAPWGVRVHVEPKEPAPGYIVDPATPALAVAREALGAAFDRPVLEMGSGGSIPLVPMLVETFPQIQVLIWGAGDHRSNWHSVDESVDLGDLERMAVAEALFLSAIGA